MTYGYRREDGSYFEVDMPADEYEPLTACPDTGQRCHRVYDVPMVKFNGYFPGESVRKDRTTLTMNNETGDIHVNR